MDLGMRVLIPKICLSCRICCGMMVGTPPYMRINITSNITSKFNLTQPLIKIITPSTPFFFPLSIVRVAFLFACIVGSKWG